MLRLQVFVSPRTNHALIIVCFICFQDAQEQISTHVGQPTSVGKPNSAQHMNAGCECNLVLEWFNVAFPTQCSSLWLRSTLKRKSFHAMFWRLALNAVGKPCPEFWCVKMMKSRGVFKIPVVGGVCAGKVLGQSWSLSVVTVEVQRARLAMRAWNMFMICTLVLQGGEEEERSQKAEEDEKWRQEEGGGGRGGEGGGGAELMQDLETLIWDMWGKRLRFFLPFFVAKKASCRYIGEVLNSCFESVESGPMWQLSLTAHPRLSIAAGDFRDPSADGDRLLRSLGNFPRVLVDLHSFVWLAFLLHCYPADACFALHV